MQYTLTKYLTADFFRQHEFTKAFLELVDEIIFGCYMESLEILSNLSFENMDNDYFLAYQNFFLNGLPSFDVNKLDKVVLSEWFSLLHVRGEISNLSKLLKFGGALTETTQKNDLKLYHSADVPETITTNPKDGIIYAVADESVDLNSDYFVNQQTPAGYKLGVMKSTDPSILISAWKNILIKESDKNINLIDYGCVDTRKTSSKELYITRRRQFDQYYSFGNLFKSGYSINKLSKKHKSGHYYFGFDCKITNSIPVVVNITNDIYLGIGRINCDFVNIKNKIILKPIDYLLSGNFETNSNIALKDVGGGGGGEVTKSFLQQSIVNKFIHGEEPPIATGTLVKSYLQQSIVQKQLRDGIEPVGGNFAFEWSEAKGYFYAVMDDDHDYKYGILELGKLGQVFARYTQPLTEHNVEYGVLGEESQIIVGQSTKVPSGTTSLESPYWWMYEFNSGSLTNFYLPNFYASDLNSGSTGYTTIPSTQFNNVYIGGFDSNTPPNLLPIFDVAEQSTLQGVTFQLTTWNSKPECYCSGAQSDPYYNYNTGVLIEPTPNVTIFNPINYALPSDMYSINGTNITWNQNHKMFSLFEGREVFPV